jgi:hypothetical protein
MARRPKFRPEIRRIKLNPEQAVLTCPCYNTAHHWTSNVNRDFAHMSPAALCDYGAKSTRTEVQCVPQHSSAPLTFTAGVSGVSSS